MTVKRMDNVGIVVEDIDAAIEFFTELGLELEGRAPIEGDWADGVTGLRGMRVEIAMMRTPDGHSRLEMSRFLAPPVVADHRSAPVNALGYLRVMFTVEDIDDTLARLGKRGAEARRRSGPVRKHVSALLHPGPRRHSHRARSRARAWRLTPPSSERPTASSTLSTSISNRAVTARRKNAAGRRPYRRPDRGTRGKVSRGLVFPSPGYLLTRIGSSGRIRGHEAAHPK